MSSSKSRAKGRSKQVPAKKTAPPPAKHSSEGAVVAAPDGQPSVAKAPVATAREMDSQFQSSSPIAVGIPNGAGKIPVEVGAPPNSSGETPTAKRPLAVPSNRFWLGALGIMIVSIALRQVQLGQAPFYPDESIHAWFAQGFDHYKYDPTFHGPLLYHLVSAVFALCGQFDYTARLVPSLLGIGLIALILGPARKWMGARGSLAAAALLAVSPSVVTYSRHLLHDALVLDLTFGAVLCFVTALHYPASEKRGRAAMLGLAACLSLFLATKANFFFILVVLMAFWATWWVRGKIRFALPQTAWWPAILFGVITVVAIAFPRDNSSPAPLQDSQHRIFQIASVLCCGVFLAWTLSRPATDAEVESRNRWKKGNDWATWVLALAVAAWIYVLLFGQGAQIIGDWVTTKHFPTDTFVAGQTSAKTAISRMLDYWGGQQKTPRLPGRHDYYVVLALLYEVPILLAALGGIWHAARHRSLWGDFLLWWAFASWTVYALANEKVPWLLVHIALPLALLGALWLASLSWRRPLFFAATVVGLVFCLRSDAAMIFERAGDNAEPLLYAQTPDAFRDAITRALAQTRGDSRNIWITDHRQWPSFWYLREKDNPLLGNSKVTLGVKGATLDPTPYRAFVADVPDIAAWKSRSGWRLETVDFLVWPRASWAGLQPARYWRWFWTRKTLSPQEWTGNPATSRTSILAGHGEWSYERTIVGSRVE